MPAPRKNQFTDGSDKPRPYVQYEDGSVGPGASERAATRKPRADVSFGNGTNDFVRELMRILAAGTQQPNHPIPGMFGAAPPVPAPYPYFDNTVPLPDTTIPTSSLLRDFLMRRG